MVSATTLQSLSERLFHAGDVPGRGFTILYTVRSDRVREHLSVVESIGMTAFGLTFSPNLHVV